MGCQKLFFEANFHYFSFSVCTKYRKLLHFLSSLFSIFPAQILGNSLISQIFESRTFSKMRNFKSTIFLIPLISSIIIFRSTRFVRKKASWTRSTKIPNWTEWFLWKRAVPVHVPTKSWRWSRRGRSSEGQNTNPACRRRCSVRGRRRRWGIRHRPARIRDCCRDDCSLRLETLITTFSKLISWRFVFLRNFKLEKNQQKRFVQNNFF